MRDKTTIMVGLLMGFVAAVAVGVLTASAFANSVQISMWLIVLSTIVIIVCFWLMTTLTVDVVTRL